MRTIEIQIYKFDELNEDAKQNALNKYCDINVCHDWWQFTFDDAKEIGLKIDSFDLDRNRHAKGIFLFAANEVAQNIFNSHGENTETYKTAASFIEDWQPIFNDYMNEDSENYESYELENEMEDLEDNFLKSLLEDYSIMLQNECKYLQSEEAIKETILCNDYDFTANGKIY